MSILISKDKKEFIINCKCGCDNTIHIRLEDNRDSDSYILMTYLNSNLYRDYDDRIIGVIKRKVKKIWAIARNKDYCYSDIIMDKEDFQNFKKYINLFGEEIDRSKIDSK